MKMVTGNTDVGAEDRYKFNNNRKNKEREKIKIVMWFRRKK